MEDPTSSTGPALTLDDLNKALIDLQNQTFAARVILADEVLVRASRWIPDPEVIYILEDPIISSENILIVVVAPKYLEKVQDVVNSLRVGL